MILRVTRSHKTSRDVVTRRVFESTKAFGGRAPPGPAGGAIVLPRPPSRYKEGRKGMGKEMVGIGDREEREGRKRREGVRTDWKRGGG